MAIFIKLLATRIVANSFLGFSNNEETIFVFLEVLLSGSTSRSEGVKEKNATSAPEISAENKSRSKHRAILATKVLSTRAKNNKLGGSISKIGGLITT